MTTKMFGERVPRVEDPRLVTGDGRFLDDLAHDALEAAFVRSPHAHARIVDVDVTDALEVDGLVAIYTTRTWTAAPANGSRCSSRTRHSRTVGRSTPWPTARSTMSARRW